MKFNITNKYAQPDPYVIFAKDKYYMYVTAKNGVELYVSDNFYDWDRIGVCYQKENEHEFWAPCVIQIDDKYYMYVSSMPVEKTDTHEQRIQVAVSDEPEGPYQFIKFLTPPFSIDPHVVKSGNELFIFYSLNNYNVGRVGTYIVVDKMRSPTDACGHPRKVVVPTLDEEIFQKDRFKKGQHWHTIEGPFYFRKGDYHYVMYSGNCYENENYFIGYAVAHSSKDDLTKLLFKKYPDENMYSPLIKKNDKEEGTGHNSLIQIKDKYYVVYHGRDYDGNKEKDTRTARFCEVFCDKEIIKVVQR